MHHSLHHLHDHDTDPQDIRNMGGLRKKMPITYITFLIATLAISGVPLFSGFLSKDAILAGAWAFGGLHGGIAMAMPIIGFGVAMMTAFYMFRLVFLTFHGEPKRADIDAHIKESPMTMKVPIMTLAALSIWVFYAFNPLGGSNGWLMKAVPTPTTVTGNMWYQYASHEGGEHAQTTASTSHAMPAAVEHQAAELAENPSQTSYEHAMHAAHYPAMFTSLAVAGLGILIAFMIYRRKIMDIDAFAARMRPAHTFLMKKWYFDEIYEQWVVVPFVLLTSRVLNWFDAHVVDGAVNGAASVTQLQSKISGLFDKYVVDGLVNFSAYAVGFFGIVFRKTQSGRIQTYIAFAVFGIIILFYVFT